MISERVDGPLTRGEGPLTREEGPRTKGYGPLTRGYGPLTRGEGPLTRGEGPLTKVLGHSQRVQACGIRTRREIPSCEGERGLTQLNRFGMKLNSLKQIQGGFQ